MSKLLLLIALLTTGCVTRVPCYEAVGAIPRHFIILNKCEGELFLAEMPMPEKLAPTPGEVKPEI